MATHTAAWIKHKHAPLEIGPIETPTPGPGEILVKVRFIAFSPIESKQQKIEVHPLTYPNILGLSFSGVVESVGPSVEKFSKGDNVAVARPHGKANDPRFGSFQQYALACAENTSKLPSSEFLESGAKVVLNLATVTAACSHFLGLERPGLDKSKSQRGERILVYGGSSSCGGLAIRYAAAAGYEVVTTSSPKNREYVTSLGPVAVIDHTSPPGKIIQDLQSHGPYHRILDTIGIPPVTNIITKYLSSAGGGSYNTLIPVFPGTNPIPENVERRFESYGWIFNNPEHEEFRKWYYETLVPQGLESGVIVSTPSQRVDGGLANTQHALDIMDRGEVSGHKLVLNPWD
ncbi:PKS-ER domain-containing protein [Fusarium keratoplasticum]|uniref:PKS-ER domain-containing protein n=1 Tax=Fusarium keratoplasticum TaxID=1328300 RepID=A0ACC0QJG5_9HYPO|nr:PKS-ER domain-containing protein [Fusarium keratoplasticum]KAI8654627.1 PKS-ER domain-containing protein [Fusarium keratoplasticum]KAI8655487.1 PKS-ER domain-containing protein [Fusarium keratoplasticum]